jgi:DNA-binding transcriptional LysR family regulator
MPAHPDDLTSHRIVEMPALDGRQRQWRFERGAETRLVGVRPTVAVDEVLTIHRLVRNGAGIGIVSRYLSEPDIGEGRLIRLLPEWSLPPVPVALVFPSRRELAPSVRAFANFLGEIEPFTPWAK